MSRCWHRPPCWSFARIFTLPWSSLLLTIATRVHGKGDELSGPGEFPSRAFCDFPVSEDAKRFFNSGQPVLQRLLPFWLASLVIGPR